MALGHLFECPKQEAVNSERRGAGWLTVLMSQNLRECHRRLYRGRFEETSECRKEHGAWWNKPHNRCLMFPILPGGPFQVDVLTELHYWSRTLRMSFIIENCTSCRSASKAWKGAGASSRCPDLKFVPRIQALGVDGVILEQLQRNQWFLTTSRSAVFRSSISTEPLRQLSVM